MEQREKYDLTTGVIWKKLLLFFLPIAVGTLFQQLYNTVDAMVWANLWARRPWRLSAAAQRRSLR